MESAESNLRDRIQAVIDSKTKPLGSLGRIEDIAAQLARIQGTLSPCVDSCHLMIFAADHGMSRQSVSAFPREVTRQMLGNFLAGGAASVVFARSLGVQVSVVDAGVAGDAVRHPDLLDRRVASGTANAIEQPAMSVEQLKQALETGALLGGSQSSDAVCYGDMGIGNTSSASLVSAKITGHPVEELVGRGTGLDDEGLERKRSLLVKAASRTATRLSAKEALAEFGGFEIAMMAGAMKGAAEAGRVVIVDGFIATAAALCVANDYPECADAFIYGHRSAEAGHGLVLDALGACPLLDLGMRLGEGTGALLAWPIVRAAAAMMREMASFESAGVSVRT